MSFVIFDTETTGLDFNTDELLEIGYIKFDKLKDSINVVEHKTYYIKNENIHNTEIGLKINQITDEYRNEHGVSVEEALSEFSKAITGCHVYAYNVNFDVTFVKKYQEDCLNTATSINDIRAKFATESVLNSIQRILWWYLPDKKKYTKCVKLQGHLHDALDDVYAELVIMCYDVFNFDISNMITDCEEYVPQFGFGKYKSVSVKEVIDKDISYVKWFLFVSKSPKEEYLRQWIMSNYQITFDEEKDKKLMEQANLDYYAYCVLTYYDK